MSADPIEDLVEEFWLRREAQPDLSAAGFAAEHPERRARLLEALAASLAIDAELPRAEPPPTPPRAIGSYAVVRLLGRGGMGMVWEVERDGRRLALKVLLDPALGGARAQSRFRREIEVLSRLRHPGIVAIEDFGEHEGQPWFAMELLPGRSLADIEEPIDIERAVALCRGIAEAVAVAHSRGIHHRDLKPANVLLRDDGAPVVVDFGLAAVADEPTLTGSSDVLGTPRYMAPEQAAGRATDARADVYAIGMIFAQLLTGERPGSSSGPPAAPALPRPLARILRTALARRPQWRYANAGALADDLARFSSGEPVLARPPGAFRTGLDHLVHSPRLAIGMLGPVAAVVAVAVIVRGPAPSNAELGAQHLRAGRSADAIAAFQRALHDAPDSAELHQGLALALERGGDLAASLASIERALALTKIDRPAWRNQRGTLLDRLGEHPRAQEVFRKLVDEHPDDPGYRFNLGYSLDADLQVRAASEVYAEVLRRHPEHHVARVTLAWLHATAKGEFAELCDPDRAEALAIDALRGDRGRTEGVVLTAQAIARAIGRPEGFAALCEELAAESANDAVRGRLLAIARSLR